MKMACAVDWSWEINYRFRVPHVDVETGSCCCHVVATRRGRSYRCDKAQMVSRLQTKVDWLDTNK